MIPFGSKTNVDLVGKTQKYLKSTEQHVQPRTQPTEQRCCSTGKKDEIVELTMNYWKIYNSLQRSLLPDNSKYKQPDSEKC